MQPNESPYFNRIESFVSRGETKILASLADKTILENIDKQAPFSIVLI